MVIMVIQEVLRNTVCPRVTDILAGRNQIVLFNGRPYTGVSFTKRPYSGISFNRQFGRFWEFRLLYMYL